MRELLWQAAAWALSRRPVADWLIRRAERTPYTHIYGADGKSVYMYRFWLFNAYSEDHGLKVAGSDVDNRPFPRLPSIRMHRIMRPDSDRDPHNHPWDRARTIGLRNWYVEVRGPHPQGSSENTVHARMTGGTATLNHGEYHRIIVVPVAGACTLFLVWRKASSWGFMRDGVHVPWRKYLGRE